MNGPVLVTGAAGFIGFHVALRLLRDGYSVIGLDNFNAYYDPALKEARAIELAHFPTFRLIRANLSDGPEMAALFDQYRFQTVIHLAAQAGVRYSLTNPGAYVEANLAGFLNVLEGCRHSGSAHLIYASSSSVYGANTKLPFSTADNVDHPVSLYAASKKANELMAHAYAHLYAIPMTGLRFFTVYGPWGRPDMAMWIFAKAIREGRPISLFNHGEMRRDFTYIDDVVEALVRLIPLPPRADAAASYSPATSPAPWRVFNIGNSQPIGLGRLVDVIEAAVGRKAVREMAPMQDGDVKETYADVEDLARLVGFAPKTSIEEGIGRFVAWLEEYERDKALT